MIDIVMPQLGESVTEGTITAWRKKVGDVIVADEFLCDVSTDKVTFEVPAPASGTLAEIGVAEGRCIPVGAVIARIAAGDLAIMAASVSGSEALIAPLSSTASDEAAIRGAAHSLASPVVRRLARENGIDLGTVSGTGLGGRVTRNDMLLVIASQPPVSETTSKPSHEPTIPQSAAPFEPLAPAPTLPQVPSSQFRAAPSEGDEIVPLSAIRRRTGEHMVYSVQTTPHGFMAFEIDYSAIERVRLARKDAFKQEEGISLTYLPFMVSAVADALRAFPLINSSVSEGSLIVRKAVNIGIAVDLGYQGLVVPVIRGADNLRVQALARSITDLANRARGGKLKADDMSGGTFTVTNPGPSGTFLSVPIINQPQSAILVTDGVCKRPAVVSLPNGTDVVAVRPKGYIGLSMDHRAFDGAYAADFMARIKRTLEITEWDAHL